MKLEASRYLRDPHPHATGPHALHKVLAEHVWCELLARIAGWLATARYWIQQVPHQIVVLLEGFWTKAHGRLGGWLVQTAVHGTWRAVGSVSAIGGLGITRPLWVTRVMALSMCKAPDRHETVMRNCVRPLASELTGMVRDRLADTFPVWLAEQSEPAPAAVW